MSTNNSLFSRKFNLPSIDNDFLEWDREWEALIERLSASEDVFPILKDTWHLDQHVGPSTLPYIPDPERLRDQVSRSQELVGKLNHELDERGLNFVWILLREEQRQHHLLNGIREACARVSLHQDARALCPEVTVTMMLKAHGTEFISFIGACGREAGTAGPGNIAFLESDWWLAAVDMPEPWPEDVDFAYTQLSLQREEFIAAFILHTLLSIVREWNVTSPIADLIKSDGFFSSSGWATTSTETPPVRCKYCTGTSEELGKKLGLVCSKCRSKLNVAVHYCSRACQSADWKDHKSHCGQPSDEDDDGDGDSDHFWRRVLTFRDYTAPPPRRGQINNVTGSPKCPNPERQLSPALQQQIALLKANLNVDYFLFDDQNVPRSFVMSVEDRLMRMCFHDILEETMFGPQPSGADVIAEYMIKIMGREPGLSPAVILAQFNKEYGLDMTKMMVNLHGTKLSRGFDLNKTYLEELSREMPTTLLKLESK